MCQVGKQVWDADYAPQQPKAHRNGVKRLLCDVLEELSLRERPVTKYRIILWTVTVREYGGQGDNVVIALAMGGASDPDLGPQTPGKDHFLAALSGPLLTPFAGLTARMLVRWHLQYTPHKSRICHPCHLAVNFAGRTHPPPGSGPRDLRGCYVS